MKVVHITEALSGGVFSYIFQLSNALVEKGVDVTVIFSRRPETPQDLSTYFSSSVKLVELPMKREVSPISDAISCVKIWRLLKGEKADVIHLHSSKAGVLGRVAACFPGIHAKVFYSPHGLAFLREDVSPFVRRIYKLFENIGAIFGGVVIASSRSELNYVHSHIPAAKSVLVDNGIDVSALPLKAAIASEKVKILTVNRISPQKAPELFARVAEAISCTEATFTWIGGGDEEGKKKLEAAGVTVYE